MVLIADCGSTKIDWCVLNGDKLEKRFFSTGVNALLMPEEKIRETFEKELAPEVKDFSIDEVYYYGAGCLSDEICSNVSRSIAACVPGAKTISVNSDLLAAARALCGTEPGIAFIVPGAAAEAGGVGMNRHERTLQSKEVLLLHEGAFGAHSPECLSHIKEVVFDFIGGF